MNKRKLILVLGPVLALLSLFLELPISFQAKIVFAVTVLAVVYWFTEVIELHVTGLLISFLLIVFAGFAPIEIFPNYFDPVVVLLLGGFMLALALQKYELDKLLAFKAIKRFGEKPRNIVLGFMLVTAFLSFWVSNTASSAVMIPIGIYIIKSNKLNLNSNFAKYFILSIAYAATIGGIGTLVGTTPNPLAAKYINNLGQNFGFLDWLFFGLPFVAVLIFVIWIVLPFIFKPEIKKLNLKANNQKLNSRQKLVLIVFFATVLLWIFGDFFSLQSSVVALIPVILFYILRLVDNNDFSKLNWPILSLIGSGIVLGYAMHESQFDLFIVSLVQGLVVGQPLFLVVFAISVISVIATMFVSNTASSALMIPLLIPLAPIVGLKPEVIIIIAAIGASLDFTAPMGTPPNAIAYSTGFFSVKEMAKAGLILSLLASIVLALFATFVWI